MRDKQRGLLVHPLGVVGILRRLDIGERGFRERLLCALAHHALVARHAFVTRLLDELLGVELIGGGGLLIEAAGELVGFDERGELAGLFGKRRVELDAVELLADRITAHQQPHRLLDALERGPGIERQEGLDPTLFEEILGVDLIDILDHVGGARAGSIRRAREELEELLEGDLELVLFGRFRIKDAAFERGAAQQPRERLLPLTISCLGGHREPTSETHARARTTSKPQRASALLDRVELEHIRERQAVIVVVARCAHALGAKQHPRRVRHR